MLTTCILAMIAGVMIGWLAMRAIGWLLIISTLLLAQPVFAQGYLIPTWQNSGGSTVRFHLWMQRYGNARNDSVLAGNSYSPGTCGPNYNGDKWAVIVYNSADNTVLENMGTNTWGSGSGNVTQTFTYGAPTTTNTCTASVTLINTEGGPFAQHWVTWWIDSSAQSPWKLWEGYIEPGGNQTVTATFDAGTGHCPGSILASGDRVGFDTPTNIVSNSTNSTRNLTDPGNEGGPGDSEAGSPDTNAPTVGDLSKILGELKGIARETTQKQTTNALGAVLQELSLLNGKVATETTARGITNLLGAAENTRRSITNMLGTNNSMLGQMVGWATSWSNLTVGGYSSMSNDWNSEGLALSNAVVAGVGALSSGVWSLTNSWAAPSDNSVWMIPLRTNTTGPRGYVDINPLHQEKVAGLMGWVKYALRWLVQIIGFGYIVSSVRAESKMVVRIPGSGLSKGNYITGILLFLKSNMVFFVLVTAIIVFGIGAIDQFLSDTGGWMAYPFAESAVTAYAGAAAPYIRAGFELVDAVFPIAAVFLMATLLFTFDLLMWGKVMFISRMMRAGTE